MGQRTLRYRLGSGAGVFVAALVFACSGDGGSGPPVPVASVQVSPDTLTLRVGATHQYSATVKDAAGKALSGRAIVWSSSQGKATVTSTGLATAVAAGTVDIEATSEFIKGTGRLTVLAVPVSSIQISPDTGSLMVGSTLQLTAVLKDSADRTITGRAVLWFSSLRSVATVTAGAVKGISPGTVQISAVTEGKTGIANLKVIPVPVASVTVSPDTATIVVFASRKFSATAKDSAGTTLTGRAYTWASSDTTITVVNDTGLVSGVAPGAATITASSDGKTGSARATIVHGPLTKIKQVGVLVMPSTPQAVQVDEALGKVYVADAGTGTIEVFNETTLQRIASIAGCAGVSSDAFVLDQSLHKLYAGCAEIDSPPYPDGDNKLRVIDTNTDAVVRIIDLGTRGLASYKIALDRVRHRLYVSDNTPPTIGVDLALIDATTDAVTRISQEGAGIFGSVTINETTNKVYVVRTHLRDLIEIDGTTQAVSAPYPTEYAQPSQSGINQRENKLYFYTVGGPPNQNPTVCIQSRGRTPLTCTYLPGRDRGGIVTNETTNKVYLGVELGSAGFPVPRIGILDGATDALKEIPMAQATGTSGATRQGHNIRVNESTNHVFFVNTAFLLALDGETEELRQIRYADHLPLQFGTLLTAIELNRATGRLYVIYNGAQLNKVAVFQDEK